MTLKVFTEIQLKDIAKILAQTVTKNDLTAIFRDCSLYEAETASNGAPKWRRIVATLANRQAMDRCGNNVGAFIQACLNPCRFTGRPAEYTEIRQRLNELISFCGICLGEDGKLVLGTQARTLSDAAMRAGRLRKALQDRRVHADVLVFCREELLHDNYFHAVFEATKSLAEKIRVHSGLTIDGAALVEAAFSIEKPILAINSLESQTEQSEQKGLAMLLKGIFGTFRNVTAHAPKVSWSVDEQDALDLLTMASYLHRRLDRAVKVPKHYFVK
jgi:uncharacterized protein (TIGR02391 family)